MQQSFQNFVETLSSDYPLNGIAQAYMQDWYSEQPIDGGVAYEAELRKIMLDGSLASLATLDKFLDAIKPHLAPDMVAVSQRTAQRNLLTFIGFYAGLTFCYLAKQRQVKSDAYWVSFVHLTTTFPPLAKVINDDFSYSMAVSRQPLPLESLPYLPTVISQSVFFPLVAILERLYPKRNQTLLSQNQAPFFGFITDSLYGSMQKLLAENQNLSSSFANSAPTQAQDFSTPATFSQANSGLAAAPLPNTLAEHLANNETENPLLADVQKSNRLRFNQFRANRLQTLADNPFISLKPNQPYVDEALYEPFGHPFPSQSFSHQLGADYHQDNLTVVPTEAGLRQNSPDFSLANPDTINTQLANHTAIQSATPQAVSQQLQKAEKEQQIIERKKPTTSDIKQIQQRQRNQLKAQKARQEALKKSIAEKAEQKRQQAIAEALANPRIHESLLNQSHSMLDIAKRQQRQQDSFSELEADLENPDLQALLVKNQPNLLTPLDNGKSLDEMYQLAKQALATINTSIEQFSNQQSQNQTEQGLQLSPNQQASVAKALEIINKTATAGHAEAMLWLALNQFRGDRVFGIEQNTESALNWINNSAKLGEPRAEKLLSKLYFRGELVPVDADLGNYWLEQSAAHGHPEAKAISQQMAMAKLLQDNRKADTNYVRWLMWGIAVLVTFAFVAVAFIKV